MLVSCLWCMTFCGRSYTRLIQQAAFHAAWTADMGGGGERLWTVTFCGDTERLVKQVRR